MPGMQFPYPRKSSLPPTGYKSARSSNYSRRRTVKAVAPPIIGGFALIWFLIWLVSGHGSSTSAARAPAGTPDVVIVTTIDPNMSKNMKRDVIENRLDYANRHGYATFFPNMTDYDLMTGTPHSWSTVPALRHAMALYPQTPWVWYLTATALIMNQRQSLHDKLLDPRKLEKVMITDKPVVPPDSVIKSFSYLKPERVELIVSQDLEGLAGGSLLVKSGEWAKYFLDAWYDPLYRSYNFQKAEGHALEHIVQWHGTILAKLALVPQRLLNSYTSESDSRTSEGAYQEGDFIANSHGCARDRMRNCEEEMGPLISRWKELRDQERR